MTSEADQANSDDSNDLHGEGSGFLCLIFGGRVIRMVYGLGASSHDALVKRFFRGTHCGGRTETFAQGEDEEKKEEGMIIQGRILYLIKATKCSIYQMANVGLSGSFFILNDGPCGGAPGPGLRKRRYRSCRKGSQTTPEK